MKPLTLACGPAVVAVTLTLAVQEPLAGMLAPVGSPKVNEVAAAEGAQVGVPPQVVLAAGVAATCTPDGKASVNLTPVKATLLGLVRVKVRVETPLTAIGFGEKDLVSVGWLGTLQPVTTMLSRLIAAPFGFAPSALILKIVVSDPVLCAANV